MEPQATIGLNGYGLHAKYAELVSLKLRWPRGGECG